MSIKVQYYQTGDIKNIFYKNIMINQLEGNIADQMAANLFLRVEKDGAFTAFPLLGKAANCRFEKQRDTGIYQGSVYENQISYTVSLNSVDNILFWEVKLTGCLDESHPVDLILGQDIGLGTRDHVMSGEAYNSQYIDHRVFDTQQGYVVCSRQNQEQDTGFPFTQIGCLNHAVSYSTDGYPFWGLSYKFDNRIRGLQEPALSNTIYQYEFAYVALQSRKAILKDELCFTFYLAFLPNLCTAVEKPLDVEIIRQAYKKVTLQTRCIPEATGTDSGIHLSSVYSSPPMTMEELDEEYPGRIHEEFQDNRLLSFFIPGHGHVVLQEKEYASERPHGHIIITGNNDLAGENIITSTSYIFGVFSSQLAVGNTKYNTLNSFCRNGLNAAKASGQRVLIKLGGEYKLLGMPAVYELGFNYARWIYKLPEDRIEIITYTTLEHPVLFFTLKSEKRVKYDFIVFHQLYAPSINDDPAVSVTRTGNIITAKHTPDALSHAYYPGLNFCLQPEEPFDLDDGTRFSGTAGEEASSFMLMEFTGVDRIHMKITGNLHGEAGSFPWSDFRNEREQYGQWMQHAMNHFSLSLDAADKEQSARVERLNTIALWYSHNARVHYASPHGLEQFTAAAWGTRDVCQGPVEYFLATQKFDSVRHILLKLYEHQYIEDGNWPQWFMYDRYYVIQLEESHGDIMIWPLKALTSYLCATNDFSLLEHPLCYTSKAGYDFTSEKESIFSHVKRQIALIKNNFYENTRLLRYGNGDWDDTLQPNNPALREKMISSWTVALLYQVFTDFADIISEYDPPFSTEIREMAEKMNQDFHRLLMKDKVVSGFVMTGKDQYTYLLHPKDTQTGLHYRLLPMTRSMISGLFSREEAANHNTLIKEHLLHADGVRLMNTACAYHGGVCTYFKRAETASNFGREIGLLYIHSHIRYIEAMAKIGDSAAAWTALHQANPILLNTVVKNAAPRQSNTYFSSSDAAFNTRYDAVRDFSKVKDAQVPVKGGWRIYSSGPGIYLNQLISQILGLRIEGNRIILDPVLPAALDGLVFTYQIDGKPVQIGYHLTCAEEKISINDVEIKALRTEQPYRQGGFEFDRSFISDNCKIDIFLTLNN